METAAHEHAAVNAGEFEIDPADFCVLESQFFEPAVAAIQDAWNQAMPQPDRASRLGVFKVDVPLDDGSMEFQSFFT